MRLALVANDASGAGTDSEHVATLLRRAGATVTVHDFDPSGDEAVAGAAQRAVAEGPDRIVVAGGDGSVGPSAEAASRADVPMAVVPTGTANDFARALDLPLDLEDACALAAAAGAREVGIDLIRAGERPFLNAASVGLSVLAARRARPLKRRLGSLAYGVGALRAGLTASPVRCRVVVDGEERFAGRAWQVIVAGTGAFGGGSELDAADPADGRLDVAVLEAGPRIALVRRAYGMRAGGLAEQEGVVHVRGRTVDLDLPPDSPFNVDGELCTVSPTHFTSRGERVRVIAP